MIVAFSIVIDNIPAIIYAYIKWGLYDFCYIPNNLTDVTFR